MTDGEKEKFVAISLTIGFVSGFVLASVLAMIRYM